MAEQPENMAMTVTELRQQILANAVRLFPTVVEDYLKKHNVSKAKPEDIFDIVTLQDGESWNDNYHDLSGYTYSHRQRALLDYGGLTDRKTAVATDLQDSRYEVFTALLDATEKALAILNDDLVWHNLARLENAIEQGRFLVDKALLMNSIRRKNQPFLAGLTGGWEEVSNEYGDDDDLY